MIKFELNNPATFALTTDQMMAIADIIDQNWSLSYDVVEGDTNGIVWLWMHPEEGNPIRHWVEIDGQINLAEEVTWDWKGTGNDD